MKKIKEYLINIFFKSKSTLFDSIEEYTLSKEEEKQMRFTFKWWLQVIMKVLFLLLIIIISFLMFGCSTKTVTAYKDVYIPVYCEFETVNKPEPTGDVIKDNIMIMKYADELLITLNKCKKVK